MAFGGNVQIFNRLIDNGNEELVIARSALAAPNNNTG